MTTPTAADELAAYVDWHFERHPVHADTLGAPGFGGRIGDFTAAAFEDQQREAGRWLSRLQTDRAEQVMTRRASLSAGTARDEVSRYCAWPTQAPSYLTGALEIEQLRQEWTATGDGGLREFHDTLAATGCLPLGLARRAVLGS